MQEMMLDALRNDVRQHMDEKRYRHTLSVEREMRYLAEALAPARAFEASVAALLHDVTKCMSWEKQRAYCVKHGLLIDSDEEVAPALLHAKTGAHFAKEQYPSLVTDAVFDAILRHTTARPPLSLLSAMLFVADFTEEGRTYPDCIDLRKRLHAKSLLGDEGRMHFKEILLRAMDLSLAELLREGRLIALQSVEARNALLRGDVSF